MRVDKHTINTNKKLGKTIYKLKPDDVGIILRDGEVIPTIAVREVIRLNEIYMKGTLDTMVNYGGLKINNEERAIFEAIIEEANYWYKKLEKELKETREAEND